ncbi:hypothetical protein CAI21_08620 [Alkalilimnicola ehrlichii]|uniref:protein kinase domain-containing protein n=1 Tax=Alkalilimnicola ehrlichii TaxID=351052 RepID=UPI000E2F9DDB|nr:hypothetical protein [Alkalilimnicola ehrlichii]RFA29887.1 hypothetical protein CAI21_08620 [Alkalilimnicola ehrlichii]
MAENAPFETLLLSAANGRRVVHLDRPPLARGGEGTIYRLANEPLVAKLYHEPSTEREAKLDAMLADPPRLPPLQKHGRAYPQLTWPLGRLEDTRGRFLGYAMPKLELERTAPLEYLLSARGRRALGLPDDYRFRLKVAYQLAHLVAELHAHGHHLIDLKPGNFHVYTDAPVVAVLDTDGFSIRSTERQYPAHVYTDGYIAPEALQQSQPPEQLGEAQDRFALAVVLFQLLNQGLHPYQGVPNGRDQLPATNGERVQAGLYAYARQAHPQLAPSPWSIHSHFDEALHDLFERAFLKTRHRPAAQEWTEELKAYLDPHGNRVSACTADADHLQFRKGCPWCANAADTRQQPAPKNPTVKKGHKQTKSPVKQCPSNRQPLSRRWRYRPTHAANARGKAWQPDGRAQVRYCRNR